VLRDVLAEEGMELMPSRQDISEIIERLDRIERIITQLATSPTAH
jgi:hypothetical protein